MKTRPIYNTRTQKQSGIAIYGDHAGTPVYVMLNAFQEEFNGDKKEAFHQIKKMQNENMLPRMGSVSKPLTVRDFELYRRNIELGHRRWQWIQASGSRVHSSTGYDSVWGYGYYTKTGFVIVNKNDEPEFVVEEK